MIVDLNGKPFPEAPRTPNHIQQYASWMWEERLREILDWPVALNIEIPRNY